MKLDRGNQLLLLTVVVLSLVAGLRVWQSLRPAAAFWTVDSIAAQAVVAVAVSERRHCVVSRTIEAGMPSVPPRGRGAARNIWTSSPPQES